MSIGELSGVRIVNGITTDYQGNVVVPVAHQKLTQVQIEEAIDRLFRLHFG